MFEQKRKAAELSALVEPLLQHVNLSVHRARLRPCARRQHLRRPARGRQQYHGAPQLPEVMHQATHQTGFTGTCRTAQQQQFAGSIAVEVGR